MASQVEFVLECVVFAMAQDTHAFCAAVKEAIRSGDIPEQYRDSVAFAIRYVRGSSFNILGVSSMMCVHEDVVHAAVSKNGRALQFAPCDFQNDKRIVLAAIKSYARALMWASDGMRADAEVVLVAVKIKHSTYEHAEETLKADVNFNVACARMNRDIALNFAFNKRLFIGFYDMVNSHIAHPGMFSNIINCCSDDGVLRCSRALTGESFLSFQLDVPMTYGTLASICCMILGFDYVHLVFGKVSASPSMFFDTIVSPIVVLP